MPSLPKMKQCALRSQKICDHQGYRVTVADGAIRGPEDYGRTRKVRGISLGVVYVGPDGVKWLAVHWEDESDPNWCKLNCIEFLES